MYNVRKRFNGHVGVLIVACDGVDLIQEFLAQDSIFTVSQACSLHQGLQKINQMEPDIVLFDLELVLGSSQDVEMGFFQKNKNIPFIALTTLKNSDSGINSIHKGAQDYLIKGRYDFDSLSRSIFYAIERHLINYKLTQILETAYEAFVSINHDGLVTEWNLAAKNIFGWEKNEIMGALFIEKIVPSFYLSGDHDLKKFSGMDVGDIFKKRLEFFALHKDGYEFPIEITIGVLKGIEGLTFNMFIRDLSESKRLEKLKNEFISTASHELRTPIAILQAALANLTDKILGNLNEKQMSVAMIAERNIKRLNKIINNLLDISRFESGIIQLKLTLVNPKILVDEIMKGVEKILGSRLVVLKKMDPDLPEYINVDEELMIQVFNNLTSNALRYANKEIVVSVKNHVDGVLFCVANDGPALSANDINQLFQKFSQVNRPKGGTGYKGTGLGLAICKEIIKQHGGKIWAESEKGGLTCFKFVIPKK